MTERVINGKTYLFIEVTEDCVDPEFVDGVLQVWSYDENRELTIPLPSGKWKLHGRPSEIPEELAATIFKEQAITINGRPHYEDLYYPHHDEEPFVVTAKECLLSWKN